MAIKYSLKVWLTSIVVAPLLVLFIMSCQRLATYHSDLLQSFSPILFDYGPFVVAEFVLSLITWIFFTVFIELSVSCLSDLVAIKYIIFIGAILLTTGTCKMLLSSGDIFRLDNESGYILYCNCYCFGWCTWYYDLNPADK